MPAHEPATRRSASTIDAAQGGEPNDSISLVFATRSGARASKLREGEVLVVGRAVEADVCLDDPALSRVHARLRLEGGALRVEDLGSHNGVELNGRRVREARIEAHDRLRLGATDVWALGIPRVAAPQGRRELTPQAFIERLEEELERARATRRDPWLAAVKVACVQQPALANLDRWCAHAPGLALLLFVECSREQALEKLDKLHAERSALISASSASAEALVGRVIDRLHARDDDTRPQARASIVEGARTQPLYELAERTGHADLPLLVLGETGAGKEVIARAFHDKSRRARGPFCELNCGAIPATLIEAMLFGHERGAFTGAERRSSGVFEQADGGTLFLDEVGELSMAAQVALLRVLDTRRIRRVGAQSERAVDVRVIAASNRDLHEMVQRGVFRADLLYRLEALTVSVPPLRERRDEIVPLAELFMHGASARWGAPLRLLGESARRALEAYAWPGNVRQLRNAIERAVAVCTSERIEARDLPDHVARATPVVALPSLDEPDGRSLTELVRNFEVARIREALHATQGNRSAAARALGLPRRTLGTKLRDYGIE